GPVADVDLHVVVVVMGMRVLCVCLHCSPSLSNPLDPSESFTQIENLSTGALIALDQVVRLALLM
ncbi:MAG TPA: hypothetical protein VGV69_01455, partial [Solirubrobacterales bacterium]|nr:hypothetical protein [Solirubrobacterales bacterium]